MIKVWAGLEARKFITASAEEVSRTACSDRDGILTARHRSIDVCNMINYLQTFDCTKKTLPLFLSPVTVTMTS